MANINNYLSQIMSARYGKDVRQAIHDSIKEIDREVGSIDPNASGNGFQDTEARRLISDEAARAELAEQALSDRIDEKAPTVHEHTVSDITDFPTIPPAYDDGEIRGLISAKQDTISDLSTIRSGAASGASSVQKPTASIPANYVPTANGRGGYSWQAQQGASSEESGPSYDDSELRDLIDGKAPLQHTHDQLDITGLSTALSQKAPSSHTHSKSDIIDFPEAYDDSEIRNLINEKAPASHTHSSADITDWSTAVPKRGVDYWTADDIAAIKSYVE